MHAIMPKSKFTTPLKRKEYQMEDTVKTRRNPLAWFSKHKKLTALLLVVLIAAVLVLRAVLGGKRPPVPPTSSCAPPPCKRQA